ncbi:MAG: DUF5658 family protein, partial [bacterium]
AECNERRGGDRRRRRLSFVLRERRSGFERRGAARAGSFAIAFQNVLTGLRDHPRTLRVLLVSVNVLNLADFLLTLSVLASGGEEANPIMRSLFALNPVYAGMFKITAVLLTTWLVWRCRRFRTALEAAVLMVAIFAGVFLYHIVGAAAFG